jgi:hypothetical protein
LDEKQIFNIQGYISNTILLLIYTPVQGYIIDKISLITCPLKGGYIINEVAYLWMDG